MKLWKKKYLALFLTVALGAGAMAFAACDGTADGGQSGQNGNSSIETGSSLKDGSSDSSLDDDRQSEQSGNSVTSDEKQSGDGDQSQTPVAGVKTVSEEEWENAFSITNYSFVITQKRTGEENGDFNYYVDRAGSKYAVAHEKENEIDLYVETLAETEEYYRYEKDEQTGEWEKILVPEETNYAEMYFALENVFYDAFWDAYSDFTYDAEKGVYYATDDFEEILGEEPFDLVQISFVDAKLEEITMTIQGEIEMSMTVTFSNHGKVKVELPSIDESVKTVSETEWENTLTATNYTSYGEMWNDASSSAPITVKREGNKYHMTAGSEEYIVETKGGTNVYYRWDGSVSEWKEDDSQPSQQHLTAEQMRTTLQGKYGSFKYNEATGCYEATNVALTAAGQTMTFDKVTVSFSDGNLSVLYCMVNGSHMRFTFSQYGDTMVVFIDKESGGSASGNDTQSSGNIGISTENPDASNNGDDHQEPKITLDEWTKALSLTNYRAVVSSDNGESYTMSRDENVYFLEYKDKTGNKFYFEEAADCVYIYVYDVENRTWSKEEYTETWKDEIEYYYGVDMMLTQLIDEYDKFTIDREMAFAENIIVSGGTFQSFEVMFINDNLSRITVISEEDVGTEIFFQGEAKLTLPQV